MLDEVMDAIKANGLDLRSFETVSKLIRSYGDLRVQDAEIKRLSQEPDRWKKELPGYYPNSTSL
jgi:hypothetical protein